MCFIHISCLKNCIKSKLTVKSIHENDITGCMYSWNNFECDICLTEYPKYIKHKSFIYYLVENQTNYEQYCQIEIKEFDEEKQKPISKGVVFISLEEGQKFTIVRLNYKIKFKIG